MLKGKTVVITGASSGLGAELARQCSAQGPRLVLAARNADALEAVAQDCRDRGAAEALAIPTDVTNPDACARLMAAAGPRIDCLVLNAGLSMWAPFEAVTDLRLFDRLMAVNYLGAVYCTHAALPRLRETRGLIVAVSSIQAKIGVPMHTGYAASKHALDGFLESLRMELSDSGVGILNVMPHWLQGTDLRASALAADGQPMQAQRRGHSRDAVPVDACARAILQAMPRRPETLVVPGKLRMLPWLRLATPGLLRRIILGKMRAQGPQE